LNKDPLVSFVCPSYNHAKFVGEFIHSLLAQTNGRWELIIIDDASTDDNLAQIGKFNDGRIRLIARDSNRGVTAGMNEGIRHAKANIIAFLASDDLALPSYVEKIVSTFAESPDAIAVYVELNRVDENGVSHKRRSLLPAGLSRLQILRKSFLGHNPLPSPGMAMRRDFIQEILLPEGVVQYSDWMLHNRILMRGDVVMLEEQLINYRVLSSSLSARSTGSIARDILETRIMLDDFLAIKDMAFLEKIFPEEIKPYRTLPARHIPYVVGRLALLAEIPEKRCWGYEVIMRHISEPNIADSLRDLAGFNHKDLMALTPLDGAIIVDEVRMLRRRVRHLRRWICAFSIGFAATIWLILR